MTRPLWTTAFWDYLSCIMMGCLGCFICEVIGLNRPQFILSLPFLFFSFFLYFLLLFVLLFLSLSCVPPSQ